MAVDKAGSPSPTRVGAATTACLDRAPACGHLCLASPAPAVPYKHNMTRINPRGRRASSMSASPPRLPPRPPPPICPPVPVQTSSPKPPLSHTATYTCHHAVSLYAFVGFNSCAYYSRAECTIHEHEGPATVTRHADTRTPRVRRAGRCASNVPDGLRRRSGRSSQLYGNFLSASRSDRLLIFVGVLP